MSSYMEGSSPQSITALLTTWTNKYRYRDLRPALRYSDEVQQARQEDLPLVALESTIYTHGFPYPDNVDLALGLEQVVRDNGGVPATIGFIDGEICVGMTKDQLVRLASAAGKPETMKISRRDLPYITGMRLAGRPITGGTTISGTMMIAQRAGIRVFGTGGLGGVHRGGQDTMDISADLTELGRTTVAVVSSGCKSFLDLPRTLEFLETQGVPVCTFADGRTGDVDIPAFYTRESGVKSPFTIQNAKEAAAMIFAQAHLRSTKGVMGGLLFANPIPKEFSIPKAEIDLAINQAVQEAADQGFHGHSNTPFILARIKDLTKGNSIPANRALIRSNVKVATQVAIELEKLRSFYRKEDAQRKAEERNKYGDNPPAAMISSKDRKKTQSQENSDPPTISSEARNESSMKKIVLQSPPDLVVFGSLAVDLACDHSPVDSTNSTDAGPLMKTSNPSIIKQTIGGVGHNVALAAHIASGALKVRLCSVVGADSTGSETLTAIEAEGLDTTGILTHPEARTAQYVAINDGKKDLVLAMSDMKILSEAKPKPSWVLSNAMTAKVAIVDGNWDPMELQKLFITLKKANKSLKTIFEPVSVPKAANLFKKSTYHTIEKAFPHNLVDIATPNTFELSAMYTAAKENGFLECQEWWALVDAFGIPSTGARDRFVQITNAKMTDEGIPHQTIQLLPYIPTILTKLGADGVLLTQLMTPHDPRLTDSQHTRYILSRNSNGTKTVGGVYMRHFPTQEVVKEIVSVNGVGDTFLGVLAAGLAKGKALDSSLIDLAQKAAGLTLGSKEAVSPELKDLQEEFESLP
ncbi:Indigoidine synthase A-like protein [Glarea lozoyensis ATCC 20868]|uniref:Indigoidine synthase A-like protein n=1 Tax=Glarea lozoyensis (strain ATCC 20868 / MF5171) TaxID=1116229 RepID=S3CM00_GLAL2|nr:Indigoidine synthase A-like protein [Glarea lozoyensis ATCC 20868]EPE26224.1 Indigoidine synthase A-like protein [Glarea lozoyensis ATCC 20868]